MRLVDLFVQRKIGPTHGSVSANIPLTKPSGSQRTESELETELVEQLDFSARVHDILTQPGIRYRRGGKERRYTADVFVEVLPDCVGSWSYFLIEVKPAERLDHWRAEYAEKIEVGRAWCAENRAEFRILTEGEIRTPYLANARELRPYVGLYPDNDVLERLNSCIAAGLSRAADIVDALVGEGANEALVRTTIAKSVANRFVACDLSKPYGTDAVLGVFDPRGHESNDHDPIISTLMRAASK